MSGKGEVFKRLVERELLLGNSVALIKMVPATWWDGLKMWLNRRFRWSLGFRLQPGLEEIKPEDFFAEPKR